MREEQRHQRMAWWHEATLGMFIHWGLYAIPGRGEWVMYRDRIPADAYARLADRFAPRAFDPDAWCESAKAAGMRYLVLTARHHDGFCLYDSAHSAFNSVRTAARRDFVAEYVAACRRHDLRVGLYYSLGDWRFGYPKETDTADGAARMLAQTHAQVRELLSQYGKIDLLWYDGGWVYPSLPSDGPKEQQAFWRADELNTMARQLQPDILINDRSGTSEDFGTTEGHVRGPGVGRAWEACLSMSHDSNSYWGYLVDDPLAKTSAQIVCLLVQAVVGGGNMLLNVGPDADGVIPAWQQDRLADLGAWVRRHAEAVYGMHPTRLTVDANGSALGVSGWCAEKDDCLYHYAFIWPGRELRLPLVRRKVLSARLLSPAQPVRVCVEPGGGVVLKDLPARRPEPFCAVIRMELERVT